MGLFPHYPATPGTVTAMSQRVLAGSAKVSSVKTAVGQGHRPAVAATSGLLVAPLATAVQPVTAAADQTTRAATIAGGALILWAKAITEYNAGVDKLNTRYATAAASSFYVNADQFFAHGSEMSGAERQGRYDAAVATARSALKAELTQELHRLEQILDLQAHTVSSVLKKGPSNEAATVLALHGALPEQARLTFPAVLKHTRAVFDLSTGTYSLASIPKAAKTSLDSARALDAASEALLRGRRFADTEVDAMVKVLFGGDTTSLRALNQYLRSEEALNPLKAAVTAAELKNAQAATSLFSSIAATSKLTKGLGVLGLASSGYDLFTNPEGHTGVRRALDVAADGAGIVGGGGSLLLGAGLIAGGPVTLTVVGGATLIAGGYAVGSYVWDHREQIADGVKTAVHWTGDRIEEFDEAVDDAKDWVEDKAEKIPVIGGLF